eukprot:Ihof_evm1s1091 gene=Ihof_evmTU1s1091
MTRLGKIKQSKSKKRVITLTPRTANGSLRISKTTTVVVPSSDSANQERPAYTTVMTKRFCPPVNC